LNYLLSDYSKGDSDGASCFFGVIEYRNSDIMLLPFATKARIRKVLDRLAAGQEYFDAPKELYDSFSERAASARNQINENH
jgi:hypothetical protein